MTIWIGQRVLWRYGGLVPVAAAITAALTQSSETRDLIGLAGVWLIGAGVLSLDDARIARLGRRWRDGRVGQR